MRQSVGDVEPDPDEEEAGLAEGEPDVERDDVGESVSDDVADGQVLTDGEDEVEDKPEADCEMDGDGVELRHCVTVDEPV